MLIKKLIQVGLLLFLLILLSFQTNAANNLGFINSVLYLENNQFIIVELDKNSNNILSTSPNILVQNKAELFKDEQSGLNKITYYDSNFLFKWIHFKNSNIDNMKITKVTKNIYYFKSQDTTSDINTENNNDNDYQECKRV